MIRLAAAAAFAFFVGLLAAPGPAAESEPETYQWTDDRGNVGFTDSLEKVPPKYRKSAKKFKPGSPQRVPTPPATGGGLIPGESQEAINEAWRDRMSRARAELDALKTERQKAQEEYESQRRGLFRWGFADPDVAAKASAKLSDLDQRIRDKEHELTVTIPDEARQAGVPPGALAQ